MSGQFKSFVSEEEVQERRKKRQEEWEKVRQPDDPEECPEEETRSLFEQLQANKDAKDKEFEDESRLRASVKGLDNDEVQFLNYVSNRQIQIEKDRNREEKSVIEEMKNAAVLKIVDKTKEPSSSTPASKAQGNNQASTSKNSQKLLLQGAIKRKSTDANDKDPETGEADEKKQKTEGEAERGDAKLMAGIHTNTGAPMVVAGILPGIADYEDSDSSTENEDRSSDSESDHTILPSVCTQRILLQEMVQKLKESGGCG